LAKYVFAPPAILSMQGPHRDCRFPLWMSWYTQGTIFAARNNVALFPPLHDSVIPAPADLSSFYIRDRSLVPLA
jgi:hypothetical protein